MTDFSVIFHREPMSQGDSIEALLSRLRYELTRNNCAVSDEQQDEIISFTLSVATAMPGLTTSVGPVCTTPEISQWFGISRQAIHNALRLGRLIAVRSGRYWHFPTWQLTRDRVIDPRIAVLIDEFLPSRHHPHDRLAQWMWTPCSVLNDCRPCDWLRDGLGDEKLFQVLRAHAC
ncbi:MAG: helix-turn-helix domain-containing protein [Actinomycetaceae bacterium]|nr:helix-turn-helix domain-containing protein [Actinomycetaceae bacterium]